MTDAIRCKGDVEMTIEWDNGSKETYVERFPNTVLRNGRKAIAASLTNDFGDNYDYFISRMVFGNGGTSSGNPKFISEDRTGLFGSTLLRKPVVSTLDPNDLTRAIFTSVISKSEANGQTIDEMGLEMNNGDLYSMTTWAGFSKTSQMQITFTWNITFL